jgi:ADP-dependent phosphofructokinase/glucokinase
MNRKYLEEACEQIDAAIFSGDLLFDRDTTYVKEFKEYLGRWNRAIDKYEKVKGELTPK